MNAFCIPGRDSFEVIEPCHRAVQAFDVVKERTSTFPFQAIWEGRQVLPKDYYKEWLRLPYYTIVGVTLGAYWAHPLMQQASHWLNW